MFLTYFRGTREICHHSLIAFSHSAVTTQSFHIFSVRFRFRDDPRRRRRHVPWRLPRQEVRPEVRGDHQAVPHHQLHLAYPHLRLPRALLQRPVRRCQRRLHVSQSVSTVKLFFKNWRTSGLFVGPLIQMFLSSMDICLGFQSHGFYCMLVQWMSSESADLLITGIIAESF